LILPWGQRSQFGQLGHLLTQHDVLPRTSWQESLMRQIRWNQATRSAMLLVYVGLIFTHSLILSLAELELRGNRLAWGIVAAALLTRWLLAGRIGRQVLADATTRHGLWLIPLCDCLGFGLWCVGLVRNQVSWRGQQFRLSRSGKLTAISESSQI
jgi:ceramide glucosyltransferase